MCLLVGLSLFCVCVRKEWEDRSAKLGDGFSINETMAALSEEFLRRARALHDQLLGSPEKADPGPAKGTAPVKHQVCVCVCVCVICVSRDISLLQGWSNASWSSSSWKMKPTWEANESKTWKKRTTDSSACWKCGKPGHAAKDCTAK